MPDGLCAAPERIPYGTTVLALAYRDGVLIAGYRRATMGNLIFDFEITGGPYEKYAFRSVSSITEGGFERLSEPETEELSREMVDQRHRRPDGPNAAP
ncbi:hypothetical protein ACWHLZ_28535 [Streptomyces chartreusis]